MGKLRKQLSAPGLLGTVRKSFGRLVDPRREEAAIPLADALMSGLAVFSAASRRIGPVRSPTIINS